MTQRLYPLRTQLNTDSGTQGDDCGPLTIINAIKWASDNKIGIRQSQAGHWVNRIRRWAYKERGGLLLQGDCLQVYESKEFRKLFYDIGYHPPVPTYHFRRPWYDVIMPAVRRGDFLHLALDYGVLRAGAAPTASDSFTGDHYIAMLNAGYSNGHHMIWDGDPLFDGRRSFPKSWQKARSAYYARASGYWGTPTAGEGRAYGITLKKGGPR